MNSGYRLALLGNGCFVNAFDWNESSGLGSNTSAGWGHPVVALIDYTTQKQ